MMIAKRDSYTELRSTCDEENYLKKVVSSTKQNKDKTKSADKEDVVIVAADDNTKHPHAAKSESVFVHRASAAAADISFCVCSFCCRSVFCIVFI